MDSASNIGMMGVGFIAILISITLRLWAKAWLMDRLGDPTPRMEGRVSLNPIDHLDPVGTLFLPLLMMMFFPGSLVYGWGKHLYSHTNNFKHPVRDEVMVSLVGTAMNVALAFALAFIGSFFVESSPDTVALLDLLIKQNILIGVFSLLPIPPLDGAVLVKHIFKMSEQDMYRYSQWSMVLFLAIILIKPLSIIISLPFGILYGLALALMY